MALTSLLDIITRACDELSLDRPASVIASTSPQVRTLLSHANEAGRFMMEEHEWGALQTLGTITTANGTATYSLASDYNRMISDTEWDKTNHRKMAGPDTPQINRYLNDSGVASTGVNKRFRLRGTSIEIYPTPTAIETLYYEYVSNKWARSSGSVAQLEFAADTDTSIFDADLMKAQIKWRWMAGKGFYADHLKTEADMKLALRIAADIGGTTISMEPQEEQQFIGLTSVPDTGFAQ